MPAPPTPTSRPRDFILQSFNAFSTVIAEHPEDLLNHLLNNVATPPTDITEQTTIQRFHSTYTEDKSSQETHSKFSASVGISGSFGFYSGSVKATYDKEASQLSTSFNSNLTAVIDCGTVYYNNATNYEGIRRHLKPELVAALNAITNIAEAAAFTKKYGTHLILGLKVGGTLTIRAQAETNTYKEKTKVSIKVEAKYKSGINSVSAAAEASEELSKDITGSRFTQSIDAAGGDAKKAAAIDPKVKATFTAWSDTCTANTAYGISESLTMPELATSETAGRVLRHYYNLFILQQSLRHPSVFSAHTPLKGFQTVTISATADKDFKIISGGARVSHESLRHSDSSFLNGTYPHEDSKGRIIGWIAASHDLEIVAKADEVLTAYALAVYDPGNLLEVTVAKRQGANPRVGGDSATATLPDGFLLTGGGCNSVPAGKSPDKYILASYPSGGNDWTAGSHDYLHASTDTVLTAYATGIKCAELRIDSSIVQSPATESQHGNHKARLGNGLKVAGGGVRVRYFREEDLAGPNSMGNLVQATYPSETDTWTEFNKDHAGHVHKAESTAYAIGLEVQIR